MINIRKNYSLCLIIFIFRSAEATSAPTHLSLQWNLNGFTLYISNQVESVRSPHVVCELRQLHTGQFEQSYKFAETYTVNMDQINLGTT